MPALMIIGEVVALADSLSWFEPEAANNDLQLQHDAATAL